MPGELIEYGSCCSFVVLDDNLSVVKWSDNVDGIIVAQMFVSSFFRQLWFKKIPDKPTRTGTFFWLMYGKSSSTEYLV